MRADQNREVVATGQAYATREAHTGKPRTPMGELPSRDDVVAAWLKQERDQALELGYESRAAVIDELLDDYRLHADTGTPLLQHACDGPHCADHDPPATGHMLAPGVPCHGCQSCLIPDCERCAIGEACAEYDPTEDMFGTTCVDCGQPITDENPSAGESPNGDGPMHAGCGEPCVCGTAFTCLAHDHDEETDHAN